MAEPRLMRTAPAAASSATEGAPGQTITATGSGPLASSAIAAGLTRPGTNKLSAPAAAYAADRSRASSIRAGAGQEHVGASVDPERDAASCRTRGGQPVGLLGRLVEPRSIPAIFDVDTDRPGLEHGRHRSRDIVIPGLDVGGHRHVEGRDDPRYDRRG